MSNEIVKSGNMELGTPISEQELKDYLLWSWTTLSDQQFKLFVWVAKASNLNPFKREIYAIPFERNFKNSNWQWEKKTDISIVSGYQIYIDRAMATGQLDGWQVELTTTGAKITIHRKDFKYPFIWEVEKSEFQKTDKEWNPQWSWKTMWNFMIKKVAIWQGFRLAFPSEMWGLPYLQEEISSFQEGVIEEVKATESKKIDTTKEDKKTPVKVVKKEDLKAIEEKNIKNYTIWFEFFTHIESLSQLQIMKDDFKKKLLADKSYISKPQLNELLEIINSVEKWLSETLNKNKESFNSL